MKFCYKCGAQNEDYAKFCTQCGTDLGAVNVGTEEVQAEDNSQQSYGDNSQCGNQPSGNDHLQEDGQQSDNNNSQYGDPKIYGVPPYSGQQSYGGNQQYGNPQNYGAPTGGIQGNYPGIEQRNIAVAIILSIVTCGIYGLYWLVKLNDEVNQIVGDQQATSGGIVLLLSIVTCGIYELYWLYKMGEKCDQIKEANGSSGILYLILALFGLSIIDFCLIQDTVNRSII